MSFGTRYGLIADVHSNRQALEAALAWLDDREVDRIYCLGDVVGYGGEPAECVAIVRERCAGTVRGNHDGAIVDPRVRRWFNPHAREAIERQAELLGEPEKEWLATLPYTIELDEVELAHSGFVDPSAFDYVSDRLQAKDELRALRYRWGFHGHTHVPAAYRMGPDGGAEVVRLIEDDRGVDLGEEGRYLVNPGAVGQPRDGDPRAACAVFDPFEERLWWGRLEYDVGAAQAAVRESGMPEFEAERLAKGR